MNKNYKLTLIACYFGYIIQAIVNNLSPLLFVRFSTQFGISEFQITFIVFLNFAVQILVDSSSGRKHIAPDLFLRGKASTSGLKTTSTNPPPIAIKKVAIKIPA